MSKVLHFPPPPGMPPPAPPSAFHMPRWRCVIHGDHDQVMCVATVCGVRRVYCVPCMVELLDRIGLHNLPPAD